MTEFFSSLAHSIWGGFAGHWLLIVAGFLVAWALLVSGVFIGAAIAVEAKSKTGGLIAIISATLSYLGLPIMGAITGIYTFMVIVSGILCIFI